MIRQLYYVSRVKERSEKKSITTMLPSTRNTGEIVNSSVMASINFGTKVCHNETSHNKDSVVVVVVKAAKTNKDSYP